MRLPKLFISFLNTNSIFGIESEMTILVLFSVLCLIIFIYTIFLYKSINQSINQVSFLIT